MAQPNIIFMITHDTGRYLQNYGYSVETPHLNQLAKEGVQFNNYYCTAPQCSPSRGSILSGKYPHNNGLMGLAHYEFSLNKSLKLMPHHFQQGGYETSLIGFSHETIGEEQQGTYSSTYQLGYDKYINIEGSRAPEVAAHTKQYLMEKAQVEKKRPFFVNVGFWETHRSFDEYESLKTDPQKVKVPAYLKDTPEVREDLALFEGSVRALDKAVGEIKSTLNDTGLADNTIVVFTTDHGIAFPRAKGTLKDAGLETALLIRGPGIESGIEKNELLSNIDIMPTLLDVAELPLPHDIDGTSFKALLLNNSYEEKTEIFNEMTWHDKYHPMRGIRTNQYKYVKNFIDGPKIYMPGDIHRSLSGEVMRDEFYVPNEEEELYDLYQDPLETNNLARLPEHKELLHKLRSKVLTWMEQSQDPLLTGCVKGTESTSWSKETEKGNTYEARYPISK